MGQAALLENPLLRYSLRTICFLIVSTLPLWGWAIPSAGQSSPITWSTPTDLSNTPQASAHSAIISDDFGYVHVFWSENVDGLPVQPGDPLLNIGNTILYTRWDGVDWMPPIDILLVPGDPIAEFPAVDLDADNRLHLVWTSRTHLYYSNAASWEAGSSHAWRKPLALTNDSAGAAWGTDVATDEAGRLHVVYIASGLEPGIYYLRSLDGGETWELARKLSEPLAPPEASFATARLIADGADGLHAVWHTSQVDGFGQAVYYARSLDGGENWSNAVQLGYRDPGDYEVAWPYIMAHSTSELHLVYVDGPGSVGRFHRISRDRGETWEAPQHILTDMVGVNGYVIPILDGADNLHLIVNMRTRSSQTVGIYYTAWMGTGWSPIVPVDVTSPAAPSAHYTSATVREGNELHLTYTQLNGAEIWHVQGLLPSVSKSPPVQVPVADVSTPLPKPAITAVIKPSPTPPSISISPAGGLPTRPPSGLQQLLIPGAGAALLLVAGAVAWSFLRPR